VSRGRERLACSEDCDWCDLALFAKVKRVLVH
jgi:hypothetical protein